MKIVNFNDPILRQSAVPLTPNLTEKIKSIVKQMKIILEESENGVALAAPQVGFSYQLFIMKNDKMEDGFQVFINPKIEKFSEEKITMIEGCLSIEEVYVDINRSRYIKATWFDEKFKKYTEVLEEFESRVFQHEYDHLYGILMTDYENDYIGEGYEIGI